LIESKPANALGEFQAVLASNPRDVKALNGRGIALDLLNRSTEAQESYRAALAVSPGDRAAQNNLGLSLALSGKYDAAIAELDKVVLQPDSTARMRQNLSLVYGLKGDRSQAERLARVDLNDADVKANLLYFDAMRGLARPVGPGPAPQNPAPQNPVQGTPPQSTGARNLQYSDPSKALAKPSTPSTAPQTQGSSSGPATAQQ
jgi:tetratricopeptide (TPR) repeat protein